MGNHVTIRQLKDELIAVHLEHKALMIKHQKLLEFVIDLTEKGHISERHLKILQSDTIDTVN